MGGSLIVALHRLAKFLQISSNVDEIERSRSGSVLVCKDVTLDDEDSVRTRTVSDACFVFNRVSIEGNVFGKKGTKVLRGLDTLFRQLVSFYFVIVLQRKTKNSNQ